MTHRDTIVSFIKNGFLRLAVQDVDTNVFTVQNFRQAYAVGVVQYNRFLRRNDPCTDLFDAYFGRENNEKHLLSIIRNIHKNWDKL